MDLAKVLEELRRELEYLDAAITSLEHLQQTGPRRGRPPRALADLKETGKEGAAEQIDRQPPRKRR